MKNVLFFGDSNTWGYNPADGGRYPFEQRWTTVAAELLGGDYHCIAAGLNGRTTVFDDPWKSCRNGRDAIDIELQSHKPLDLVMIMLGTNDLKFADASRTARGLETLTVMVKMANERFSASSPVFPNGAKILIAAPILVGESNMESDLMPDGHSESKKLAPLYKQVADGCGAYFIDAADHASPCEIDGEHMTPEGHKAFGEAVARKISEILSY